MYGPCTYQVCGCGNRVLSMWARNRMKLVRTIFSAPGEEIGQFGNPSIYAGLFNFAHGWVIRMLKVMKVVLAKPMRYSA